MKLFFGRRKLVGYMLFIEFDVSGPRAGPATVLLSSLSLGFWTLLLAFLNGTGKGKIKGSLKDYREVEFLEESVLASIISLQ